MVYTIWIAKNNIHLFFLKMVVRAWILALSLSLTACVAIVPGGKSVEEQVADKWGIEITSVRMSAAGHMVDFRYRVLDSKKAETLFVRANKPYLIDQKSEKVLAVPSMGKIGPLRTSNKPKEGRIYWMFFSNPGGFVQSGNNVTVVIGDFRVENIVVQ